ncbi:MAG: ParB/RepB/Spo0J family partition protein [Desulfobacterota bacterium]|nr:ParB/RepB/Spo0J family partition protein [Thermodesulfobacteriota bacterium]MDW8002277.1 ParB/RepB/Spo0J family partition protein [Deltaproteobacteria bacterium]
MQRKDPLGRGLRAILKDIDEKSTVLLVAVEKILPNPNQPRTSIDEESLFGLAQSIKEKGVLQPLLVRKKGENYELIAGERRLKASILAGLKEVPVIVRDVDDKESLEIALIENLQREDLNPIEVAKIYKRFVDELGYTHEELAKRIGVERTSVTNTIRLLKLPEWVQEKIKEGYLSSGHGRILLSLKDENEQRRFVEKILKEKSSVRDLERETRKLTKKDSEFMTIEDDLSEYLKTKVQITYKNRKGKIIIEFFSKEDLFRLLELIRPSRI